MWGQLWISLLDLSIRAQLCSHLKRRRCRSPVRTAVSGPRLLQGVAPAPAPDRGLGAIARHRHPLGTDVPASSGISERRPASPGHVTSARQLKFMPLSVVTLFPPSPQSAGIWVLGEMKTKSHSQKRKIFYLFCKGFAHRNQKGMKSCRIIWKRRTRQWHLSHCVIHAMIH